MKRRKVYLLIEILYSSLLLYSFLLYLLNHFIRINLELLLHHREKKNVYVSVDLFFMAIFIASPYLQYTRSLLLDDIVSDKCFFLGKTETENNVENKIIWWKMSQIWKQTIFVFGIVTVINLPMSVGHLTKLFLIRNTFQRLMFFFLFFFFFFNNLTIFLTLIVFWKIWANFYF